MTKCRSCGAEIKFIRMKSGKWNPVDPARRGIIKDGGHEVLITDDGELIQGTFASVKEGANGFGYISHFATCPNANSHRKRAKHIRRGIANLMRKSRRNGRWTDDD